MSNSKLVSYVKISPNCTKPLNQKIDRITIHMVVGQASVESLGELFANPERQASSNYGIGYDGRIACYVEEEDRSWCSGSRENDHRAITIEVASDTTAPYAVNDKAFGALLDLLEDICRRHNMVLNYTGGKDGNMTLHKWFQATDCPGAFLEGKHPEIAAEVNRRLQGGKNDVFYRVQCGAFNERKNAEAMRDKLRKQGYPDAFIVEVKK